MYDKIVTAKQYITSGNIRQLWKQKPGNGIKHGMDRIKKDFGF